MTLSTPANEAFSGSFERTFVQFAALPDYAEKRGGPMGTLGHVNRNYLRQMGKFITTRLSAVMHVDDRGGVPTAHIDLGALRPGQSVRAEVDLTLLPSAPGDYAPVVTVLSRDLVRPLIRRHAFSVLGSLDA